MTECKHEDHRTFKRGDVAGSLCIGCANWFVADGKGWRAPPLPPRAAPAKKPVERDSDAGIKAARAVVNIYRDAGAESRVLIKNLLPMMADNVIDREAVESLAAVIPLMSAEDHEYAAWQFDKIDGEKT